jgi:hypothetical protein
MFLYRQVLAAFRQNGTSFSAWCKNEGICREWAYLAVTGKRNGQKAKALREKTLSAVKVGQC